MNTVRITNRTGEKVVTVPESTAKVLYAHGWRAYVEPVAAPAPPPAPNTPQIEQAAPSDAPVALQTSGESEVSEADRPSREGKRNG